MVIKVNISQNLDAKDRQILALVQRDGKMSQAEIARRVGLSAAAVNERLKKLEQAGVIRRYAAQVDARAVGASVTAFVEVFIEHPRFEAAFLARVMKLAGRAIQRDARNAPDFARQLTDGNEVIRYWAAQGLLMLKTAAAPAAAALEKCLGADASHPVRIVAAEALAAFGSPEPSLRYLSGLLSAAVDARIRLQALNALTFIGAPARAVLPAIERAVAEAGLDEYIRNAGRYLTLVLNGTYVPSSRVYQGMGARER